MYDREIRWLVLAPVSVLLGIAMLSAEVFGLCPAFPARPDLFWCLAFLAGIGAAPGPAILAAGWCGLVRDIILGPRLGSAMLAYVVVAWAFQYWKPLVAIHLWPVRAFALGLTALAAALLRHFLETGGLSGELWVAITVVSVVDAALTMVFYLPFVLVLSIPSFRPWRERGAYFF